MIALSNAFLDAISVPPDGTRPARNTSPGGGVTWALGTSGSEGSYTQFLDGSTDWSSGFGDGFGIWIAISNTSGNAAAHPCLATIGIDLAGGTSYTEWIHDLVAGPVGGDSSTPGDTIEYFFPIIIPNGASLAIKGQDANASTVGVEKIRCRIFGKPTRPELMRFGTFVQTFGADTANSRGTLVTAGTTSEGSYAELGTLDKPIWGWEYALCFDNSVLNANVHHTDIAVGDASNKRRVIRNGRMMTGTGETSSKFWSPDAGTANGEAYIGEKVYGRVQTGDNAAISGTTVIAYGIGG